MNIEQVKGNWKEFKGIVKEKWGKLTDDDLVVIDGEVDQLAGKLEKSYGITKENAEKQIEALAKAYKLQAHRQH